MIEVPPDFRGNDHRYVTAVFSGENGEFFTDKVILLPESADPVLQAGKTAAKIKPGVWCNYSKGFRLEQAENDTALKLSWEAKPSRGYGNVFLRSPVVFAKNEKELGRGVRFIFRPGAKNIAAVSLLFLDKSGETFQLKQNVRSVTPGEWRGIDFDPMLILGKNVIHYGGNKDGKVDFPVRFLGFNVDIRKPEEPGSLLIRNYEILNK